MQPVVDLGLGGPRQAWKGVSDDIILLRQPW